jgi:hypothetical protein
VLGDGQCSSYGGNTAYQVPVFVVWPGVLQGSFRGLGFLFDADYLANHQ